MSSGERIDTGPLPQDPGSPSSDPDGRQGSSASKRRPSRAGTRSVATLSPAQLERKRANDREAQRAIRQRTKEHIERLEGRIRELEAPGAPTLEQLNAALRRNKELEDEVAYLRVELHKLQVSLGLPEGSGWDGMSRNGTQPNNNVPLMSSQPINHSNMATNNDSSRPDPYAYRPGTQWQSQSPFPASVPPKREMTPSTLGEPSPGAGPQWPSDRNRAPDHHPSPHQAEYPHMLTGGQAHEMPVRPGSHVLPYQTPPHENQPYHHIPAHNGAMQPGQNISQYSPVHGGHAPYPPHHQSQHSQSHQQQHNSAQPAQGQTQQQNPARSPSVGPRPDQPQMNFYGGGFPQG